MKNKDKLAFLSAIAYLIFVYIGMHAYVINKSESIEEKHEIRCLQMQKEENHTFSVMRIEQYVDVSCRDAHFLDADIVMK